jgi:hypothetical protein
LVDAFIQGLDSCLKEWHCLGFLSKQGRERNRLYEVCVVRRFGKQIVPFVVEFLQDIQGADWVVVGLPSLLPFACGTQYGHALVQDVEERTGVGVGAGILIFDNFVCVHVDVEIFERLGNMVCTVEDAEES